MCTSLGFNPSSGLLSTWNSINIKGQGKDTHLLHAVPFTGEPHDTVLGPFLFFFYACSLMVFSCHYYADYTQPLLSFPSLDTHVSAQISACLADMSSWWAAHQLKQNPRKTALLYVPGDTSLHQDLVVSLENSWLNNLTMLLPTQHALLILLTWVM